MSTICRRVEQDPQSTIKHKKKRREEKDFLKPRQSLASERLSHCLFLLFPRYQRPSRLCFYISILLSSHGLMACLLFCILSDFRASLTCCRFILTLCWRRDLGIDIHACMGGHAATTTTLFIICTASDIAISYINYVLSNFQR